MVLDRRDTLPVAPQFRRGFSLRTFLCFPRLPEKPPVAAKASANSAPASAPPAFPLVRPSNAIAPTSAKPPARIPPSTSRGTRREDTVLRPAKVLQESLFPF